MRKRHDAPKWANVIRLDINKVKHNYLCILSNIKKKKINLQNITVIVYRIIINRWITAEDKHLKVLNGKYEPCY